MSDYPWHVTDKDLLFSLGRVTATFNALDHCLNLFVASLIDKIDLKPGYMLACEMRYQAKVAAVVSLYSHRITDPTRRKSVKSILSKIDKLENERNRFAHSYWDIDSAGRFLRTKSTNKFRKGYQTEEQPIAPRELDHFADRITSLGRELMEFWDDYITGNP